MSTTVNIHSVKSIDASYTQREGTQWMEFIFVDDDNKTFSVTAFVEQPLFINGADFINHMAAGEAQQS